MDEWTSTVRGAIGLVVFLGFLGIVVVIFFITQRGANSQFESLEASANYESYDKYDGVIIDKAMAKNIARANYTRIPIKLGNSAEDLDMNDTKESLLNIAAFFKAHPPDTQYEITCSRYSSGSNAGNIYGMLITVK